MSSQNDTDWAESSAGNLWKRSDGRILIVGSKDGKNYWVRVDEKFITKKFDSESEAQEAAEAELEERSQPEWWEC
jgi:hypothetical protein